MSKRMQLGLLGLVCLAAGWLAGQINTARALAEPAGNSLPTANASKYELHSIYIGDSWEAWRIDRNSGEAWHEADNKLVKVKDPNPVPSGDYNVSLITNGKLYLAHRIDQKTGRMWRIDTDHWVELVPQ